METTITQMSFKTRRKGEELEKKLQITDETAESISNIR